MFKQRSYDKEILDEKVVDKTDLFRNLFELDIINKYLGGYSISANALTQYANKNKEYHLVDIGSGGGDTLKYLDYWAEKKSINLKLAGIDLKKECIEYSLKNKPNPAIKFICDDYRNIYSHLKRVDIIHACLFCHHFCEKEITALINFCVANGSALIINDLERNPFAYYAIKFLTRVFSKSYMVKHDAPLSVLRGFKKAEWEAILEKSDAKIFSIKNKWAFRHQIIVYAN